VQLFARVLMVAVLVGLIVGRLSGAVPSTP
jgi:hypothetical protein